MLHEFHQFISSVTSVQILQYQGELDLMGVPALGCQAILALLNFHDSSKKHIL